MMLKLERKSL